MSNNNNLPLDIADKNKQIKCELIGKGSYGKVYKIKYNNDNFCYKKFNLFLYEYSNILNCEPGLPGPGPGLTQIKDIIMIENNIKEVVFYKTLNRKIKENKDEPSKEDLESSSVKKAECFTLSFFLYEDTNRIQHIPRPTLITYNPELLLTNNIKNIEIPDIEDLGIKIFFKNYGLSLNKHNFITKDVFINIFSQICSTILMFFKSNITHGDLKPSNILLKVSENKILNSLDYNITIIDFGSVCFSHGLDIKQNYQRCTLFYSSPEEFIEDEYSFCNDWWSIGTIMFEYITGKYFIECLLKYCNVDTENINLFIKYSTSVMCSSDFNAIDFISNFYLTVTQSCINRCISYYIKDKDLQKIISYFLIKDVETRTSKLNNGLKLLNIEENILAENTSVIKKINILPLYNSFEFPLYDYEMRKYILSGIYSICIGIKKFGKELFGHTTMIIDRFYLRLHHVKEKNLSPPRNEILLYDSKIIAICCLAISSILLKSEVISFNFLIKVCKDYFIYDITLQELEEYFIYIFQIMDFNLFNISPDMLIPANIKKNYTKIFKTYIKYPIINETSYDILQLILEDD